ncbi:MULTISPECIES: hypothetical protein [unclassified Caballeronia]|uniref:hypothetical protein n=1 Tax=unclassified Caballeronia TaxID=2646786 RepID=UPI002028B917|nr:MULTISPECIES: hypothetical protein [unclassified Caballeronia]MDR5787870.1 hypothetical protein [Caballeronia sp. LP003]
MDLARQEQALAVAIRDIADAEQRIRHQTELVAELARDGHDIKAALELLDALQRTLRAMIEHRNLIAEVIEKIRQGKL